MRASATARRRGGSTCAGRSAVAALDLALEAAPRLPLGDVASLVPSFLATGEGELDLGAPVPEVEPCRDEREAALGGLRGELVDLAAVEEQLAVAVGLVWLDRGLRVRGDVCADEPELAVARLGVGATQAGLPLAERLDLAAGEDETRFDALEQVVLVPRAAVVRDQLLPRLLRHRADCRLRQFRHSLVSHVCAAP